jgi:hypothetical protein
MSKSDDTPPPERFSAAWWWERLNSPFVLFLLSSIVVAWIGNAITDRRTQNEKQARLEREQSELMIELAVRTEQIHDRIAESYDVKLGRLHPGQPIRPLEDVCHEPRAPNTVAAPDEDPWLDPSHSDDVQAYDQLQRVVQGSSGSTSPRFAKVHLIGLIAAMDHAYGDKLGSEEITYTVARERRAEPRFAAMKSAMALESKSACVRLDAATQIQRYYDIRRGAIRCAPAKDGHGQDCHPNPSVMMGSEPANDFGQDHRPDQPAAHTRP